MKTWSFYNKDSGLFIDRIFSSSIDESAILNTPEGCEAIEGKFDHLSQRVDIETGNAVDYQPSQPSDDHEWNTATKRWIVKPEVIARQRDIAHAKSEIERLETSQLRTIREYALGSIDAQARLKSIDDQIAIQRQVINLNMSK